MAAAAVIPIAIAASSAIAAGGAICSGVQQSEAADYNAKVAQRQAQWAEAKSKAEADRVAARSKEVLSAQRARLAAGGQDPTDQSPLMILAESAARGNVDYRTVLQGGQVEASNLRSQADQYRSQATSAQVGAGLGATSALVKGASDVYGYKDEVAWRNAQMDRYTGGRGQKAPATASDPWEW